MLLLLATALPLPCACADAGEAEYARIIAAYAARGALDEAPMLTRARAVAERLVRVVAMTRPEAAAWPWEIHVTSDPSVAAFCMARGKVLVGAPFVRRLALDDAELAMLIAHEMAHALAGHRRELAPPASADADPAGEVRATQVAMAQEDEADRLGMQLAHRAGWPPASLAGFFDKLAASEPAGSFSTTHMAPAVRAANAREMAARMSERAAR
jgi:predicted Zn-dependent protease